MVSEGTEPGRNPFQAMHDFGRPHAREERLHKIVEQNWWPEINHNFQDWMTMCEPCTNSVSVRFDAPLKSQTVIHLLQQVGMDISSMSKTDDWYHLPAVATEFVCRMAESHPVKKRTFKTVVNFFYKDVNYWFCMLDGMVLDGGSDIGKWTDFLLRRYNI